MRALVLHRAFSTILLFVLVAVGLVLASPALAEPLRIMDVVGQVRSEQDLKAGSSATVRVTIKTKPGQALSGVVVALVRESTGQDAQTAVSDQTGVVEFKGIAAGNYVVEVRGVAAEVSGVEVKQ